MRGHGNRPWGSPAAASSSGVTAFIGDYFGNTFNGGMSISTSVSTFNDTSKSPGQQNPSQFQQQVIAELAIPT